MDINIYCKYGGKGCLLRSTGSSPLESQAPATTFILLCKHSPVFDYKFCANIRQVENRILVRYSRILFKKISEENRIRVRIGQMFLQI